LQEGAFLSARNPAVEKIVENDLVFRLFGHRSRQNNKEKIPRGQEVVLYMKFVYE
jgi:hypothetical protein